MKIFITNSEQETIDLGYSIGSRVSKGDIVLLFGGLGSGKTVMSKGIAKGLEVESYVTSPTFTLMHVHEGRIKMYHFDLYRLNDMDELADLGFEEFLYSDDGVAVVEWAERMKGLCPERYVRVDIERMSDNIRKISIDSIGYDLDRLEDIL
jgi:tRNA threonylcarbamoyladenosine biosynthesis protein TsaE